MTNNTPWKTEDDPSQTVHKVDGLVLGVVSAARRGGRGWRADPKVKPVLVQLGLPTPTNLEQQNAVTLRVVEI